MPSRDTLDPNLEEIMLDDPFPPEYWAALRRLAELEEMGKKRPSFPYLAKFFGREFNRKFKANTMQNHYQKVKDERASDTR